MWPLLFWLPHQELNEKPQHSGSEPLKAGTQLFKTKQNPYDGWGCKVQQSSWWHEKFVLQGKPYINFKDKVNR